MKKMIAMVLSIVCILGLVGCNANSTATTETPVTEVPETTVTEEVEIQDETTPVDNATTVIAPLPETLDLAQIADGTLAVSIEEGNFYKDENGNVMVDCAVFVYDLYDMVDIAMLKEGDTIILNESEVVVESLERTENGSVVINGGLDNDGYELRSDDSTVFYEIGYSDTLSYYEFGEVSLPISADFVYTDSSDLEAGTITMTLDEFMAADNLDYYFNANNTTLQVMNGAVVALTRIYTP